MYCSSGLQIAGRDTTAQALSWMFYLIYRDGTDTNIAKLLTQEVDDVLRGADPTYETYKQQKYAEAWYVKHRANCERCLGQMLSTTSNADT